MTVEAILFDLGDTLFRLRPIDEELARAEFAATVASRLDLSTRAANDFAAAVLSTLARRLRDASLRGDTVEHRASQGVMDLLDRYGAAALDLASALDDAVARADISRFEPPPDCAARVAVFHAQGYRLAAVSNTATTPATLNRFLDETGLLPLFEAVVYSVAVGHRKPAPVMYETALRELGVAANQAVFVGDRVREDIDGPHAAGLRAVLTHEFRQELPRDSHPEAIIASLPELQRVLEHFQTEA